MTALYEKYKGLYPFDPTYGFTLEELLKMEGPAQEPPDYDSFWEDTFRLNSKVPLKWEEKPTMTPFAAHPGYQVTEIYFDTLANWRVGAWFARPEPGRTIRRAVVMGHGYGPRGGLAVNVLDGETAVIFVCAPGFDLSVNSKRVMDNSAGEHVITGIESPETYLLRFCVTALWSAATLMSELFPGLPLYYRGWSMGGGLGTLMLPWDRRFQGAELGQPTFGNHPFRLKNPSQGSAAYVRALYEAKPEIAETLAYYDSVFAARRIKVPVVFGLSIFDPAVPAPGQFAVANSVPKEHATIVPWLFGHTDINYTEKGREEARQEEAVREMYRKVEGATR